MLNIGSTIDNRYRIIDLIGSGGMADVYLADDFIASRNVAIKIMKESLLDNEKNLSSFKEEALISASMSHPNIVQVYNEGVFNNLPYMVIEYFKEQTLDDKLEYLTKFSVKEAVQIMIQILDALSYTHAHRLIHRDIKPQNIFYLSNGTIKLGDFGIAVGSNDALASKSIIGSVYYLAPEVYKGRPFSVQSDIYACGITLFQLVTGRLPFDVGDAESVALAHVQRPMPIPSLYNNSVSKELDEIILKATSKNPYERYQSALDFKRALVDLSNGVYKKQSFFSKLFKKN